MLAVSLGLALAAMAIGGLTMAVRSAVVDARAQAIADLAALAAVHGGPQAAHEVVAANRGALVSVEGAPDLAVVRVRYESASRLSAAAPEG